MKIRDAFRRPFDLSIVWLLLPFGLFGAGMAVLPLRSWDYWWHISFGRMIAATHEMPLYNHFLYTMPADAPSYVQAWLSQWALYEIHHNFGLHTVLIIRNAFAAIAYTFLGMWAAKRANSAALGGILACAGAVFGFYCIAARTHLLAWPLFLVVLPIAYGVRHGKLPRSALGALPLLSIAWVNLHGTFMIPTLVSLAFFGAEVADIVLGRRGRDLSRPGVWLATMVASFAATFVNPRGYEVYLYLVDLPTNPENLKTVTEWFSATPLFPPFFGAFFWFLLVVTLGLMYRARKDLDFADLFILLGFSALAIQHSRALLWVGLAFPIVAAPYVRSFGRFFENDAEASQSSEVLPVVIAVALVVTPLVLQPWGFRTPLAAQVQPIPTRTEPPLAGLVSAKTPIDAAEMLKGKEDLRIFHDHQYPGFLLYWLGTAEPKQMVFLDNRVELPPDSIWRLMDSVSLGRQWRETFEKYDVNAVVASKDNQGPLIEAMRGAEGWELKFENDFYALYIREGL